MWSGSESYHKPITRTFNEGGSKLGGCLDNGPRA
jgi:hypothetical protein